LTYVYTYISRLAGLRFFGPTVITILADEDYYSQSQSSLNLEADSKQRFPDFGVSLKDAHKTGLGSSAALVTALTTALLMYHVLRPEELQDERTQAKVHNLAQAAHCAAQGKVGSGFDVAAAVYGSCVYRRFSPSLLEGIGDPGSANFAENLFIAVEDLEADHKWDAEVIKSAVNIPKEISLIMCDVDCGSETPGMVKKILSWRKENPEDAGILWGALQKGNEEFAEELRRLSTLHDFPKQDYSNLRDIILTNRSLIQEMSSKSRVPVEPKVQSELLDACSAIPGVVGGVVPGAGGFDAITLLVMNQKSVLQELEELFATWSSSVVDDGGQKIGKIRLLGVKQDLEGVRIEEHSNYVHWTQGGEGANG
jgi:phosphomevalonate kinase